MQGEKAASAICQMFQESGFYSKSWWLNHGHSMLTHKHSKFSEQDKKWSAIPSREQLYPFPLSLSHKHEHTDSHSNDGIMVHMQSKSNAPWPAHCCNNTRWCVRCKLPSNFPLMHCLSQTLGTHNTIPYFHIWNLSQLYNSHTSLWNLHLGAFPLNTVATSRTMTAQACHGQAQKCAHFSAALFLS